MPRYLRYVKPAFDNFVLPTARHADIVSGRVVSIVSMYHCFQVVPGSNNSVAIDLITTHIRRKMAERARHFRKHMVSQSIECCLSTSDGNPVSKNLIVLPQTPQLKVCPFTFNESRCSCLGEGYIYRSSRWDIESPGFYILCRPTGNVLD
jgi:uridine kinase